MSDLVKEGREKLEGLTDEKWRVDKMMHVDDSQFIAWSRNNMAALLDQIEAYELSQFNQTKKINELEQDLFDSKCLIETKDKEIERIQAIVLSKTQEFTKLHTRNELLEKVVEAGIEFLDIRSSGVYTVSQMATGEAAYHKALQALKESK